MRKPSPMTPSPEPVGAAVPLDMTRMDTTAERVVGAVLGATPLDASRPA